MRLATAVVSLAFLPVMAMSAQAPRWVVASDFAAGVFIPTGDLATSGVTRGRMRQAAVLTAALHLGRTGSPFGVYLAMTQAMHGGIHVSPTPECTLNCQARDLDHGRLWTLTAGLTTAVALGPTTVTVSLGGGARTHATFGEVLVGGVPQQGEFWPSAFLNSMGSFAAHLGLQVGHRVGRQVVFLGIDDFVAKSDVGAHHGGGEMLHDLTLRIGLRVPWS